MNVYANWKLSSVAGYTAISIAKVNDDGFIYFSAYRIKRNLILCGYESVPFRDMIDELAPARSIFVDNISLRLFELIEK